MASSRKAADLRRDPRCVLHSAVTSPDSGEGEFKVYGSALEVGDDLRGAAADAWWSAWPADRAVVFSLHIEQAVFPARRLRPDRTLLAVAPEGPA
jgi:hypothetical protein